MKSYHVKHKLFKRIGEPLYLIYDQYNKEYDSNTIKEIEGFNEHVKHTFLNSELIGLILLGFNIGFGIDDEWELVEVEEKV